MTTPDLDFPMPYTLSLYAKTKFWWDISPNQQGSYANAFYQHQLPRGEYQILASLTSKESVRMFVRQNGHDNHIIHLIDEGVDRETRTGITTITITEPTGTIEFRPLNEISQASMDASVPLVVTIFPYQSFTP